MDIIPQSCLREWPEFPMAVQGFGLPNVIGFCFSKLNSWDVEYNRGSGLKTFIHEFAHTLDVEIQRLDPKFRDKLIKAYETDPKGFRCYTPCQHAIEYWARGVAVWFLRIAPIDDGYNYYYQTFKEFEEAHPLLPELISEWFPRVSLNYDLIKDGFFDENLENLGTHF